jgi:hypothetical protein
MSTVSDAGPTTGLRSNEEAIGVPTPQFLLEIGEF